MLIAKLIEVFITDSAKSTIPVADLLEQARTIACAIKDNDFAKFCEKELNGYDEEDKAPDHRLVEVITQSWYDGPLKKTDVPNIGTNVASTEFFRKSIKFICELLNEKKDFEEFLKWPNDPQKDLYKNRIIVKRHYLQRIESEVRRQINEWKSQKINDGTFSINCAEDANGVKEFDYNAVKELLESIKELTKESSVSNNDRNLLNTRLETIEQKLNQKDSKSVQSLLNSLGVWAQNIACSVIGADIYSKIDTFLKTVQ